MSGTAVAGADVAAAFLRDLLSQSGRYRERWVQKAGKPRAGSISQAAVARVIVEYAQLRNGALPDYRTLRSRVHRALAGQSLTADTLALFVGAFGMSEDDTRELWARFAGTTVGEIDALRPLAPPSLESVGLQSSRFEVLSSEESHYIGEDGTPTRHHTRQTIKALIDGLERFPVQWDTQDIRVSEANFDTSHIYRSTSGTCAFDLIFPQPLRSDQVTQIEYEVQLHYSIPQPDFRRIAVRPMSDMSITVYFGRVPDRVWWASWRDPSPDSPLMTQEPVPVNHAKVSKSLSFAASSSIVGFCWAWDHEVR